MILQEPLNEQEVQALHTAFHTMQAEAERLRVKAGEYETTALHLQEERAEVERLRDRVETLGAWADDYKAQRDKADAEVERLRAALEDAENRAWYATTRLRRLEGVMKDIAALDYEDDHADPSMADAALAKEEA